ncbi:TIGR01777 family oxidoreductase [Pseudocolwellia sp. AS88]|uniref:TIGR01777 family oxidoreductase n=1 Tax=Pseudocolwellia sp. AS88 TaxID=3063958 RepID=UPI0026F09A05|nr:TIGR01777 family oxidoreductase [Pseudocolwellia sp. AS88]MDO7085614.1 TIGR01777 family oxidoreductase [Pseudocolwellia sp. AS88]
MNILITGGTGFIGTKLCSVLHKQHHRLVVVTRHPEKAKSAAKVNVVSDESSKGSVKFISSLQKIKKEEVFDAVINLAGEPIADKRWSNVRKQEILNSRLDTTSSLIEYFNETEHKPKLFISGSAIGYYGIAESNESIDEYGSGDNSFSSELCQQWEALAVEAETLGIRTCLLRTGVVLGKNGGALSKMLPPFKLGLGGKIGSGKQWMSWIHLDDLVGIILHCIVNEEVKGAINGTAPEPKTNADFSQSLGKALNRPTVLPMPAFVIKLLMGNMGEELLLAGKKIIPAKALATGYVFKYPKLDAALVDIVS